MSTSCQPRFQSQHTLTAYGMVIHGIGLTLEAFCFLPTFLLSSRVSFSHVSLIYCNEGT